MELFFNIVSFADTTLRIVGQLHDQFSAYKSCPRVLHDLLKRAAWLRGRLDKYKEDADIGVKLQRPISLISGRILHHIAENFQDLTKQLEHFAESVGSQSRMRRFLASNRVSPQLQGINRDLQSLDKHMDLWELSIHHNDDILGQLAEIKSLLSAPAIRDLHHLMTAIGQFLISMNSRDVTAPVVQERNKHLLGLLTSQELRNPVIMKCLLDDVSGFEDRLRNTNISSRQRVEIMRGLNELKKTFGQHPAITYRPRYELDISSNSGSTRSSARAIPLHREQRRYSSQGDGGRRWRTVGLPPPVRMGTSRASLPAWSSIVAPSYFSVEAEETESEWETSGDEETTDGEIEETTDEEYEET